MGSSSSIGTFESQNHCSLDMADKTLFEMIVCAEIPSHEVARGDGWYAFLDINPRRPGHTLVVPNRGVQNLAMLDQSEAHELMNGILEVQRKLSVAFGTTDFSVVLHDGVLAGQEVPHVHFHVIPRELNDGGRTLLAMWPNTVNASDVDHDGLSALSKELMEA